MYLLTDEQYQQVQHFIQSLDEESSQDVYWWGHKRSTDRGQSWVKTNRGTIIQAIRSWLDNLSPAIEEKRRPHE